MTRPVAGSMPVARIHSRAGGCCGSPPRPWGTRPRWRPRRGCPPRRDGTAPGPPTATSAARPVTDTNIRSRTGRRHRGPPHLSAPAAARADLSAPAAARPTSPLPRPLGPTHPTGRGTRTGPARGRRGGRALVRTGVNHHTGHRWQWPIRARSPADWVPAVGVQRKRRAIDDAGDAAVRAGRPALAGGCVPQQPVHGGPRRHSAPARAGGRRHVHAPGVPDGRTRGCRSPVGG